MIDYAKIKEISLSIHITFGFISLTAFWLIFLLPKKNYLHKKLGYLYLITSVVIFFTSWLNFFILKYVFKYYTNSNHVYGLLNSYYTTFAQASSLQYAITHIPIWIIAQKDSLSELHSSKLLKFFITFCFLILIVGVIIGILNFSNSILLTVFGLFILPYVLIPVLIFLLKIKKGNVSGLDSFKFHVYTLIYSGMVLNIAFLGGGGSIRYLKGSFNEKSMITYAMIALLFIEFFKRKMISRLAKKYYL